MATHPALRVVEYNFVASRPWWRSAVVVSVMTPVLYLTAMGLGLGSLVGASRAVGGRYLDFVGPGLLAASSMQVAAAESMFPVMAGIKWIRTWHGILATPVAVGDLIAGHFLWVTVRLTVGSGGFFLVLALFGVVRSPVALLAIPTAVLCGMAFSAPIAAFSSTQQNDQGFVLLFRLAIMPMFLFSGTFFPVSQLPHALQVIARGTPLWHGVELTRGVFIRDITLSRAAGHVAYLATLVVIGWLIARITFRRRLTP